MIHRLLLSIVLPLACAACLILPIPTAKHTPKDAMTRGEIENRALKPFSPGRTGMADVLLAFGEPDAVGGDGRWLLYRWITVRGYLVVETSTDRLGTDRNDLLFEFDAAGVLVRFGRLETLVARGLGSDLPVDRATPMEIRVLYNSEHGPTGPARLVLTPTSLTLEPDEAAVPILTVPSAQVLRLDHDHDDDDAAWYEGWIAYHLDYTDEAGRRRDVALQIDALSLPRLARYLRAYSPEVRIVE